MSVPKKKRKRGRPSEEQELDLNVVLDQAIELFAANGYEGTKLTDIADASGISKSLINYHFNNKESIWKQAVQKGASKFVNRLEKAEVFFKDFGGIELLKIFARQFVYFSAEHPAFHKIVFQEMCAQTERSEWLVKKVLQPLHERSKSLFLLDHKDESEIPISHYICLLVGATNAHFIHAFQTKIIYGIDAFDKDEIEYHADIICEVVIGGFLRWSQKNH